MKVFTLQRKFGGFCFGLFHLFSILVAIMFIQIQFAQAGELMIVGIDTKVELTNQGIVKRKPAGDAIAIFEIGKHPEKPLLVAELPLINSLFGPPTNLAITPDGSLALVANSVRWEQGDDGWESPPDNKIHVINLTADPPTVVGTVEAGQQPSGLSISRDGQWMAVANRKDLSLSIFSIQGQTVTLTDTVGIEGEAAAVAMTPDAKRVLVTKFSEHSVAVIENQHGKLSYDSAQDLPVGRWPYNVQVTPNGRVALVANNGNKGQPDGHMDTVSVVDLAANPPRVVDHVVVGDGPEGMAISPDGTLAVVPLLDGSAPLFEGKWFFKEKGSVAILSIDGTKVRKTGEVKVGRFPEGVGFSRDGRYVYVGDLLDDCVSILRVVGSKVEHTGKGISLSGHPGSLRTMLP